MRPLVNCRCSTLDRVTKSAAAFNRRIQITPSVEMTLNVGRYHLSINTETDDLTSGVLVLQEISPVV